MSDIFLSFCISTYNRADKVVKIVKEMIKCRSKEIEIIISDDCSSDNTIDLLEEIDDARIHVYRNKKNIGPKKNWYKTLDYGRGEYIFHVLDRDWINSQEIEKLISILKKTNVGYAYCGESIISFYERSINRDGYVIFQAGIEGMKKFGCVPAHPTGVIFKREFWKAYKNKKQYFYNERWGVYPHGFVCAYFAMVYTGAIINNRICKHQKIKIQHSEKSHYYEKHRMDDYWWTTKSHFRDLIRATNVISKMNMESISKATIIKERYKDHIYTGTLEYRLIAEDQNNAHHYNIDVQKISNIRIIINALAFYTSFVKYFNRRKMDWNNDIFRKEIRQYTFRAIFRSFTYKA